MAETKPKGPIFDVGLCRCCGYMKRCRLLNAEYEYCGTKEVYSDMIMDAFGLLLSHLDGKPTERLVCATCVVQLRGAVNFKQQVLRCEQLFLHTNMQQREESTTEEKEKNNFGLVKMEEVTDTHIMDDTAHDSDSDRDVKPELHNEDSNDDIPLSLHAKKQKCQITPEEPKPKPSVSGVKKRKTKKTDVAVSKNVSKRKKEDSKSTMETLQQLNREKDVNFVTETNILTIVEYSYVCPFKCRHNNLLCYYCGQPCPDPMTLRTHTLKEHDPKKFKVLEHKKMIKIDLTRIDCRLCEAKISNLNDFKLHITEIHKKDYYFEFTDSVLPFNLTSDVLNCYLCDENFLYFHALNKHMNVHFRNYVCETCGLGFVDKCRLVMHVQRHLVGDFPCEQCNKVFKAQYNRDLHVDRVHNKKGRVYCPKCDVKLMSYPQKLKHLVEVHGEEPLSFPCQSCDKVYLTRRMLTIHRRKDHLKDYRYECQYCGQRVFTRFALNNHIPRHTGERNYKCKICEKTYPRLKTLKDHVRIHTNDRRYRCHVCGQAFIQNCSLKGHLKSQHPEYG